MINLLFYKCTLGLSLRQITYVMFLLFRMNLKNLILVFKTKTTIGSLYNIKTVAYSTTIFLVTLVFSECILTK